jgi:hypothetical protein
MRLEIANKAELEAAYKAVEELRSKRVRHIGRFANRYEYPCESSTREKAFSEGWAHANDPPSWLNGGRGTLELLLCTSDDKRDHIVRDVTQEEATAAATAIQWLGTNVGFCDLCEWLKAAGYEFRKIKDGL